MTRSGWISFIIFFAVGPERARFHRVMMFRRMLLSESLRWKPADLDVMERVARLGDQAVLHALFPACKMDLER